MNTLTHSQEAVLRAFDVLGAVTDGALATYVHHMDDTAQSSSGVRTRRNELVRKGLVKEVGHRRLKSGKLARVHDLTYNGRRAVARLNRKTTVAA